MEPFQQREDVAQWPRTARAIRGRVAKVLGQQEPHEGEVLVLPQKGHVVAGRDTAVERPLLGRAEVCRRDLHAGSHGSDGTQLRVEARPVELVGLVEQLHGADVIPGSGADLRSGHEPSVPVLGDRAVLTQHPRGLEVRRCTCQIVQLAVQLGQPHVQVGSGPRVRLAAPGRGHQGLLVRAAAPGAGGRL